MQYTTAKAQPMHTSYHREVTFPNGYGASIISSLLSYGGSQALFEIALVNASTGKLVYRDDFANGDVLGHLDFDQVAAVLKQISEFPPIQ